MSLLFFFWKNLANETNKIDETYILEKSKDLKNSYFSYFSNISYLSNYICLINTSSFFNYKKKMSHFGLC